MVKLRRILSNRNDLKWIIISFSIFCIALGLALQALKSLDSQYPVQYFYINYIYFTTHSNILILVILILQFTRYKKSKIYDIFVHIGLVNILLTGSVFHLFLGPYMDVLLVQHLLHTVSPIMYLFFYFFIHDKSFNLLYIETLFIYPIIYTFLVYFLIEPKLGNTLELVQGEFQGSRYIYPFFDPFYYEFDSFKMIQFFTFSVVFIIVVTLLLTQPTKRYIERKINESHPNEG